MSPPRLISQPRLLSLATHTVGSCTIPDSYPRPCPCLFHVIAPSQAPVHPRLLPMPGSCPSQAPVELSSPTPSLAPEPPGARPIHYPWSMPRAIIMFLSGSCQYISFQAPTPFHSYVPSEAQAHSLVHPVPFSPAHSNSHAPAFIPLQ